MELIDTHAHLDLGEYFPQFAATLAATQAAGVKKIVMPGVTQAGWARLMGLHNATREYLPLPVCIHFILTITCHITCRSWKKSSAATYSTGPWR